MRGWILSVLLAFSLGAFGQASPYNLNIFKTQSFTATGQTGTAIQLNGLVIPSTVGSSYASGTITVTGVALTTVSFQVMGSSDNGATFYLLPVSSVSAPGTPATTVTATGPGLYQFNLAGLTHIKLVTTGTFTATSVSFTLTGSPNAPISRNGSGGGGTTGPAGGDLSGTYPNPVVAQATNGLLIPGDGFGINWASGSQIFEALNGELVALIFETGGGQSVVLEPSDGSNTASILALAGSPTGSHTSAFEADTGAATGYFVSTSAAGSLLDSGNTYETQLGIGADGGGDTPPVWAPTVGIGNTVTTIKNTKINLVGAVSAAQNNLDFYVAGSPSTCAGGTTQLECAAIAANTWANANLANTIIHLAPGVNISAGTALTFTGTYAPSIVGDGTFGSLIRQTATISAPVVNYGCNVFASSVMLKDFQIDADFNAPSALYIGKSGQFNVEGVIGLGAVGTGANSNFVQIGDSTCGGGGGSAFEGHIRHLTISGRGTGPTTWATATCTQSAGTPSCSVTSGGTYHWNASPAYIVGYQNGTSAQPCAVMGTATPTFTTSGTWTWGETFYSQTLNTYTLSSVSLSGFSGCAGNFYLFVPDLPSPAYGLYLPFSTDMVFDMLVVPGAGQKAGVLNGNTANIFNGFHAYNGYVGYQGGGGWINGYDCDSNLIMMRVVGSFPVEERGCNAFYPSGAASQFRGAVTFDLSGDTNHQSTFSQNNVVGGTPTDWHAFLQSDGPTDQTGNWPGSLIERDSPTLNPAGNLRHDTSTQVTTETTAPEVPATASANFVSPLKRLCENLWGGTVSQQNCWAMQVTGSGSGVPTQEIFNIIPPSNALAPVSGRFWIFNTPSNAAINGTANVNSINLGLRGSYGNGTAPVSAGWNFLTSFGSGTSPLNTLLISPTFCASGCTISTTADYNTNVGYKIAGTAPSAHYPRGNGTDYVDGTIQETDLPSLVTAGSCTECNATYNAQGIATAFSSAAKPHMTFGGASSTTFTSLVINYGGSYTPTLGITFTGMDVHLDTAPVGCTTAGIIGLVDETSPAFVTGSLITLVNGTVDYHITLAVNGTATHRFSFGTQTAQAGCTTSGGSPHYTVEYVMQ